MDILKVMSLVKNYINSKEGESFNEIMKEMEPLVKKYAYKLYYLEYEDSVQELNIAIYEAILNLKHLENDYAGFSYLVKCVKHKFCKLYAQSVNKKNQLDIQIDSEFIEIVDENFELENMIFLLDLENQYKICSLREREILSLLMNGYSDAEIGNKLGISRQYVNRFKKKLIETNKKK